MYINDNPKYYGEYLVKLKYKGFNPFDISDYKILTYYPNLGWQGIPNNMIFDGWTYLNEPETLSRTVYVNKFQCDKNVRYTSLCKDSEVLFTNIASLSKEHNVITVKTEISDDKVKLTFGFYHQEIDDENKLLLKKLHEEFKSYEKCIKEKTTYHIIVNDSCKPLEEQDSTPNIDNLFNVLDAECIQIGFGDFPMYYAGSDFWEFNVIFKITNKINTVL